MPIFSCYSIFRGVYDWQEGLGRITNRVKAGVKHWKPVQYVVVLKNNDLHIMTTKSNVANMQQYLFKCNA